MIRSKMKTAIIAPKIKRMIGMMPAESLRYFIINLQNAPELEYSHASLRPQLPTHCPLEFSGVPDNQVTELSSRNLIRDWTVCCNVSSRSVGVSDSIHRIRVRSTPSSLYVCSPCDSGPSCLHIAPRFVFSTVDPLKGNPTLLFCFVIRIFGWFHVDHIGSVSEFFFEPPVTGGNVLMLKPLRAGRPRIRWSWAPQLQGRVQ
jgi:hypothetical protein